MATVNEAIATYVSKSDEYQSAVESGLDKLNTGLDGVKQDQAFIKKQLEDINNNGSTWTPENQSSLDAALARQAASATRVTALGDAIKALDDATESVPPAPPVS